jgi:transcriptional regulator with XRE-family HTH domain
MGIQAKHGKHQKRLDGLTERIRQLVYESGKRNREIERDVIGNSVDVSHSMLYHWLNEGTQPSAYYLVRICEYFDVSADWLLGLSDRRERR